MLHRRKEQHRQTTLPNSDTNTWFKYPEECGENFKKNVYSLRVLYKGVIREKIQGPVLQMSPDGFTAYKRNICLTLKTRIVIIYVYVWSRPFYVHWSHERKA